ncbi:hypothetical protein JMF89_05375 [Clostridiaceae bacterium UIB06]|uniref:Uncharacterized protein n=1 Tax=Clostridium thailandense TaxID=2794346 RepID=A0A949TTQ8_9CLOT|nr:hypothetical protein [Clostridium thailandense]MBV7275187.1 hypothetical protein [Clostridium thailandense]MCH5136650.1 hypothetical protein [Clostridiaceae bacterium UIB06]
MIDRLNKAREEVEKAFNEDKAENMGKMAKRFKNLYFESLQKGEESREFHYAEYIKKVIMLYFENILNGYGDAETLYEECEYEAQLAGIEPNITINY